MSEKYINNYSKTVPGAIGASDTSITLSTGDAQRVLNAIAGGNTMRLEIFGVSADSGRTEFEIIMITGGSGDTLNCTRAQEGTFAYDYLAGSTLRFRVTAAMLGGGGGGGGGTLDSAIAPLKVTGTAVDADYNAANKILKLDGSGKIAANMIPNSAAGNGIAIDATTGVISDATTKPLNYTFGATGTAIAVTNNMTIGGILTLGSLTAAGGAALPITGLAASTWQVTGGTLTVQTTSNNLTVQTVTSGTLALTSAGALTLTGAAASTWSTSAGALSIDGFGGINFKKNGTTYSDHGVTTASTITYGAGISLAGAAGAGALSFGSMTGDTTLPTGALTYAGASGKAGAIGTTAAGLTLSTTTSGTLAATSAGALTLTGGAASTWSLTGGALTVQCAAAVLTLKTVTSGNVVIDAATGSDAVNIGTSTAGSVSLGRSTQNTTVNGRLTAAQDWVQGGVQSPASFSSNQTDYAPASFANCSYLRLTPTANVTINSLTNRNVFARYTIINLSTTNTLTLLHDDGSTGTASMRIICPNSVSYVIPVNGAVDLYYDNTLTRWRVVGSVA